MRTKWLRSAAAWQGAECYRQCHLPVSVSIIIAICLQCVCVCAHVCGVSIPVEKKGIIFVSEPDWSHEGLLCVYMVFLYVWTQVYVLCTQVIPFPCPSCLLRFNNRPGNKDVAFSLRHVILVVCSLSVRWPRLLSSMGDTHLYARKHRTHIHTPQYEEAQHIYEHTQAQSARCKDKQAQDADPSCQSLGVRTKILYCPGDRTMSDWQRSCRKIEMYY